MTSSNSKSEDFPKCTPAIVNKIIQEQGADFCLDDLNIMSQQKLKITFDSIQFGLHNT